jgi:hypothetical protein
MTLIGVFLCSIAVGFFKNSLFGVDPFQCFAMGSWGKFGSMLPYGTYYTLISLVMLAVDCVFVYHSWAYAMKMGTQISQGMEIPMRYMYGIMPVCGALAAVCIAAKLIEGVRAPRSVYEKKEETAQ